MFHLVYTCYWVRFDIRMKKLNKLIRLGPASGFPMRKYNLEQLMQTYFKQKWGYSRNFLKHITDWISYYTVGYVKWIIHWILSTNIPESEKLLSFPFWIIWSVNRSLSERWMCIHTKNCGFRTHSEKKCIWNFYEILRKSLIFAWNWLKKFCSAHKLGGYFLW